MAQIINIVEVQANFSQIVTAVKDRETVIQRGDRPVAVLISYEQYQELLALRRAAQIREDRLAVYDEIRARNLDVTPEQVEADVAEAVTAVRDDQH